MGRISEEDFRVLTYEEFCAPGGRELALAQLRRIRRRVERAERGWRQARWWGFAALGTLLVSLLASWL
jgi:hypothetical protein